MDGFLQRKIREQNKYDSTQRHLWCWQPAVPEVMKLLVVFSEQPGWRGRKLHIHLAEAAEGARQAARTGLGQMSWWRNECKRGASKPVSKCGAHLVPFACRRGWGVGHAIPSLQITATHEPMESFQQNAETDQKGWNCNLIYMAQKLETRKRHDRACPKCLQCFIHMSKTMHVPLHTSHLSMAQSAVCALAHRRISMSIVTHAWFNV